LQEEGWDFEEDIQNEDMDAEVDKELLRQEQKQQKAALTAEKAALDAELKKVRFAHGLPDVVVYKQSEFADGVCVRTQHSGLSTAYRLCSCRRPSGHSSR
jgi:hypothetical protein